MAYRRIRWHLPWSGFFYIFSGYWKSFCFIIKWFVRICILFWLSTLCLIMVWSRSFFQKFFPESVKKIKKTSEKCDARIKLQYVSNLHILILCHLYRLLIGLPWSSSSTHCIAFGTC